MDNWKQLHLHYLKTKYGKAAERWKEITYDDRLVFCNLYKMMLEALESLPDEPNIYVRVAMNHDMEKDCKTLDEIMEVFKDR